MVIYIMGPVTIKIIYTVVSEENRMDEACAKKKIEIKCEVREGEGRRL